MHACQLCNTNTQSDMKQLRVADNILRCIIKNVTVRQHQVTPPIFCQDVLVQNNLHALMERCAPPFNTFNSSLHVPNGFYAFLFDPYVAQRFQMMMRSCHNRLRVVCSLSGSFTSMRQRWAQPRPGLDTLQVFVLLCKTGLDLDSFFFKKLESG